MPKKTTRKTTKAKSVSKSASTKTKSPAGRSPAKKASRAAKTRSASTDTSTDNVTTQVDSLADVLNERGLSRVEVETESYRIVVERDLVGSGAIAGSAIALGSMALPQAHAPMLPAADSAVDSGRDSPKAADSATDTSETIDSPFVGTFYRSSNPESPPFVSTGQVVEPGQSLCIIEAMKLMNEIEAEARFRIIDILVENESPVEYGQPLFRVERA